MRRPIRALQRKDNGALHHQHLPRGEESINDDRLPDTGGDDDDL